MPTATRFRGWSSGSKRSTTARGARGAGKSAAPGYQNVVKTFTEKISSYKTLCQQATGPSKGPRPSATTLNSFSKWVEKGAVIHKVSPAQVRRWCKTNQQYKTPGPCKMALSRRFGKTTIKAVMCDKTGRFLVACAPTVKGKKFGFPR